MSEQIVPSLAEFVSANEEKLARIMASGNKINTASMIGLRFETFLDTFLSDEDREAFELNYQARLGAKLDEVLASLNRTILQTGIQGVDPKKLIIGK